MLDAYVLDRIRAPRGAFRISPLWRTRPFGAKQPTDKVSGYGSTRQALMPCVWKTLRIQRRPHTRHGGGPERVVPHVLFTRPDELYRVSFDGTSYDNSLAHDIRFNPTTKATPQLQGVQRHRIR